MGVGVRVRVSHAAKPRQWPRTALVPATLFSHSKPYLVNSQQMQALPLCHKAFTVTTVTLAKMSHAAKPSH